MPSEYEIKRAYEKGAQGGQRVPKSTWLGLVKTSREELAANRRGLNDGYRAEERERRQRERDQERQCERDAQEERRAERHREREFERLSAHAAPVVVQRSGVSEEKYSELSRRLESSQAELAQVRSTHQEETRVLEGRLQNESGRLREAEAMIAQLQSNVADGIGKQIEAHEAHIKTLQGQDRAVRAVASLASQAGLASLEARVLSGKVALSDGIVELFSCIRKSA